MEPIFEFEGFVPAQIQQALESAYRSKRRIRIWYGFTESHILTGAQRDSVGRSWGDDFDVTGTVGRSTGRVKIPLLVNNARSLGGSAILVNSIIRIDDIFSRTHLFKHPAFRSGFKQSEPLEIPPEGHFYEQGYRYTVKDDRGQTQANFKSKRAAQNFIDFQNGERYSK